MSPLRYLSLHRFQYLSLVPALFLIFMVSFYPLGYTIYLSFFEGGLARLKYVGIGNYAWLLEDDFFWESARISVVYCCFTVGLTLVASLGMGILLAQPERGNQVFKYIAILPWIISAVVAGILWKWILSAEFGAMNEALLMFGLERVNWLGRPNSAMIMIIAGGVWKTLPFTALLFYAAVLSLPQEIYESALTDGAGPLQRFARLTLPLLRPAILVVLVILTINFFNELTMPLTITNGGPSRATTALPLYMWRVAFRYTRLGLGSVIALVLFVVNIGLAIGYIKLIKAENVY